MNQDSKNGTPTKSAVHQIKKDTDIMPQQTEQSQPKESPFAANPDIATIAPRPYPTRATFGKYSASID